MPEERLKRLAKDLEEGRLKPVYLFDGPDEYRRRRGLDAVKKAARGDDAAACEFEELGAVAAVSLCERARMVPFFVTKRVLVAAGVEDWGEADVGAFGVYAAEPAPDAVVILWAGPKLDRRKKTYKLFEKLDAVYTFNYLGGASRRARIAGEARRLELKLAEDAAAYLDAALGPDLYTIVRELEKLATYADGREVTAAQAAEVIGTSRLESAYDMVRHVAEGKPREALAAIERLLTGGERVESLLGLLARQLRLMWLAQGFVADGLSRAEIAGRLGVAPYFVGEYVDAAARLAPEQLARLHHLLSELDVSVKTGRLPGEIALALFAAQAAA